MLRRLAPPCSLVVLLAGCATRISTTVDTSVPALIDVNATSPSFDQVVHPDDYAGQISGWYFGHAT